jgi:hypothetical protein
MMRGMPRQESFQVVLSAGEELRKSASESDTLRKNLAQAQYTIAELRMVKRVRLMFVFWFSVFPKGSG